ncbi:MAG: polysaccharide deacetylase family protein [Myxococcota bacterium]|nr:polysaccharide deacetylase family protein [Myxococcota bacterium]
MPISTLKVAMTVDDLFMWPGLPFPEGSSPQWVSRQLIEAFADNGVKDVYAFSCTRPVEETKTLHEVLDAWCSAGHHVGNHTHYHCALNWCSAESYERDMERSEAILRPWIERAPTRYFRFAFDMWGDQREKTDRILLKLARTGFHYAPISVWFADTLFMFPHFRALAQKNSRVVDEVETLFVDEWMAQLKSQAEAARDAMGRDVTHVALVHGVPLAGATMGRICQRMREAGVEFVPLEEAMRDPFNAIAPPLIERRFRNFTQKWCAVTGTPVDNVPPRRLAQLESILPMPGMDPATVFKTCFTELGAGVGGTPVLSDFLE